MSPIILKDLSPAIGTYLAFFATPAGTRAYLWGAASHPREWLEIRDPLPQVTVGRAPIPGGRDGAAEILHGGRRLALAGLVMHRLDARRLLERLGDPTDVDVEDTPPLVVRALAERDEARREEEDRVADRDEVNEARADRRDLRGGT